MAYAFIELRSDNEKFIISTLISDINNKPDKRWVSLTIQEEDKEGEFADSMKELTC